MRKQDKKYVRLHRIVVSFFFLREKLNCTYWRCDKKNTASDPVGHRELTKMIKTEFLILPR